MKKFHFIGVGGIGMSGLAKLLLEKNLPVSGSDINSNAMTETLSEKGAHIFQGHSAQNINQDMTVIYSSGVPQSNPEYQEAINLKCPLLHRSDLLVELAKEYRTLAVAGTHGKTTTSALLAAVLKESGLDPSFALGGIVRQYGTNAGSGTGSLFVAEADESDGTFMKYEPYGAILTNIGLDHLNHYGDEETLLDAFSCFIGKVQSKGHFFWCGDDKRLSKMIQGGISYGFGPQCQLKVHHYEQKGWSTFFDMTYRGKTFRDVEVALIGKHNVLNSLAVFGLALELGAEEHAIREALKTFQGVKRRCERQVADCKIELIDDYAHHPTEIKTTLNAIRTAVKEKRLIAVYQPHRFSRVKDCLGSFKQLFDVVDELIVTDIYAAGEEPIDGVTSEQILNEIKQHSTLSCQYVPRSTLAYWLTDFIRPHDVVVSLGAGDITNLSNEIIGLFKKKSPTKLKVALIGGGANVEHEVSLQSVHNVSEALNLDLYDVTKFGVSKDGNWTTGPSSLQEVHHSNDSSKMPTDVLHALLESDIACPIMHGPAAEDGTIQGLFETLDVPYIGPDWRSCALCMDKALLKHLLLQHRIPTSPFLDFSIQEWAQNEKDILAHIQEELKLPLFVKPVHQGSSVGIKKVERFDDLKNAIEHAFKYNRHILVENGVMGRELEFAVYGNDEITILPPGEICANGKMYDYEAKYGEEGFSVLDQAPLNEEKLQEGIQLAKEVYRISRCTCFARIDFFLDEQESFWFNEINPIPGFTDISMYPKICNKQGISTAELMDLLIVLGLQRKRQNKRLLHSV